MITVDLLERVLEAPFAIAGIAQDAPRKACAALEDETTVEKLPPVDEASVEASLVEAAGAPKP